MNTFRTNDSHDDRSALDKLEHTLYDPKGKVEDIHLHHVRDKRQGEIPTSWGDNAPLIVEARDGHGSSFGFKLLLSSVALLILALAFTGWRVMSLRNVVSSSNIDLSGDITPFVEGGAETPLVVTLFNRNTSPLQEASLTLMYKKGTGAQDQQEKVQEKRDIGSINQNEYKYQDFNVVLFGAESESRDLTLKLEYKVAGSNAVFSKIVTVSTVLKTPPISVRVDGPQVLSIGQNGTYVITVKNNSATTSVPSVLQLTLPNTFSTADEDPKSNSKGPSWIVSPLEPRESKKFSITGSILGTQGETLTMKAIIGSQDGRSANIGVVFASQTQDIKLRSSPLVVSAALETDAGVSDVLRYGDKGIVVVTYTNAGDFTLKNLSLKLDINGDAPLVKQIVPENEGFYDSTKQTVTWDSTTNQNLANLPPGATETFRVLIPIALKGINSPALKINLTGSATDNTSEDVVATVAKTWVVQGNATLSAQTRYKNTTLANTGPIPPVPNTETTYAVHLVTSAQNALSNTVVAFALPSYVTWKNETTNDTQVTYDVKSRTVFWNIGSIDAGKSVSIDMKLAVKPSQSHVGATPPITSGLVLDATEEISRAHIRNTIPALTTKLSGETWPEDPSRVADR
jgi:uncharacterized repeat protein (TIGR01451 family)